MIDTPSPLVSEADKHRGARIAVFAGSQLGSLPQYKQAARTLGSSLVAHHIDLVFGGTSGGLMGVVAETVYAAGGRVIGVVPAAYWPGLLFEHCTRRYDVADLRERKALMASLADAFIVLPGGPGTIDELMEIVALAHIGQHHKPIGLCNTANFFSPFLALLDHLQRNGMVEGDLRHHLLCECTPALLLQKIGQKVPGFNRGMNGPSTCQFRASQPE
jgi:cytokinin riboside 5'-monophosphate phosphoribohydrolase